MLDLKRLWLCCAPHTFKPKHTRTDKGSMEAWLSIIRREIGMSMYLVILGRPPGRALFNVKSRTLRALTTAFLLMEIMLSPWQLLSFFSFLFFLEQDARTYTNSKTRYELRKKLTLGYSHTSPTLGGVVVDVAHMFICHLSVILFYLPCVTSGV